ncbi:MAG TPA: AraC family transcriptional regulator [Candidatus Methylacidiphilales bacterium]|nr:AraC family transcriptional regulator [Candidatus Methylacidiphilales bacterium]
MKAWIALAARFAAAPPLRFVHGMRHAVAEGLCCAVHSHPEVEIVFHPTGSGLSRGQGQPDTSFKAGDAIIYASGQPHDQVMETPGEDFCVQLALPAQARSVPRHGFRVPAIEDPGLLHDLHNLSQDRVRVSRAEQIILDLRATATLCNLIHLASKYAIEDSPDTAGGYVPAAERYIREKFAVIRTLGEVAAAVGIGYDHLRHLYKAQRGRSLVKYLNTVRLERAKTLLTHSRLPLKQVAAMSGFRDEYYFSAVFRRYVRMPPGRYRRR